MDLYGRLNELNAELTHQRDIIQSTDAHAMRCYKLHLEYEKEYPGELESYNAAITRYNELEIEIAEVEEEIRKKEEERKKHEPQESEIAE